MRNKMATVVLIRAAENGYIVEVQTSSMEVHQFVARTREEVLAILDVVDIQPFTQVASAAATVAPAVSDRPDRPMRYF